MKLFFWLKSLPGRVQKANAVIIILMGRRTNHDVIESQRSDLDGRLASGTARMSTLGVMGTLRTGRSGHVGSTAASTNSRASYCQARLPGWEYLEGLLES